MSAHKGVLTHGTLRPVSGRPESALEDVSVCVYMCVCVSVLQRQSDKFSERVLKSVERLKRQSDFHKFRILAIFYSHHINRSMQGRYRISLALSK